MSSLMDPKNYDLNSTSTRKNLPQPCPLLRVRSKGLECSRPLEAACQFVANLLSLGLFSMGMSSTLCWHLQTGSKVDLLGFPLISGGTTSFFSLASISFHLASSPGRIFSNGAEGTRFPHSALIEKKNGLGTRLAFTMYQAEPVGIYGCMNFFSVELDRNFRSDLNTTNLRVLLLPSHS